MKWVYIKDIHNFENQEVEIKGWLYNKRSSGKIHFWIVRDGTGFLQCVVSKKDVPEEVFELHDKMGLESSLIVYGKVVKQAKAPGGFELFLKNAKLIQAVKDYPIQKKEHSVEFLMPLRHLWLRSRKQFAIMKIRDTIIQAIEEFLHNEGFIRIDAPILTPASVEGTTTLFETNYFGQKAYLSQSGQLYMEAAAMAYGKVYCFGPTFRAEKSKTRRHLMEFWMVEPEIAYATLDDIMQLAENFVTFIVKKVLEKRKKELEILERDISKLEKIEPPFPKISYDEAVEILHKKGFKEFPWGEDFGSPHETTISEEFEKPVIIHRYPTKVKAFYMKRDPKRPEVVLCMDMLAPEGYGEIIGGGQREENAEQLRKQIKEFGLPEEVYEWYLDLRKYGSVPHSGFGLGLERTIMWICGLQHVRETIPFPRLYERIYP